MRRRIWVLVAALFAVVIATAHATTPFVFTKTPPKQTNSTSAHFEWTGTAANYKCSLDEATPASCESPQDLRGLSEGPHKFSVQESGAGTAHIEYDWTVDLTPPTTVVTQKPPALSNSKTATFAFNSPDSTATFQCSLNGSPPQPCTSPVTYTGLADATRTLLIQAVDPAGNVDTQAQPITWTVDTTPPDTVLAKPGKIVGDRDPSFTFTSSEMNATFQCSLDKASFAACTSPDSVHLSHSGPHKFSVRAVDAAGNVDPTPAVYSWTSDLTAPKRPEVAIFAAPRAKSSASPIQKATPSPGVVPTFTNPLSKLLATPAFTLATRLHAQWKSDSSAVSYDVTVTTLPDDSTGQDLRGDDVAEIKQYSHTKKTALLLTPGPGETVCVKVDARDKVGNVSNAKTACTTIPASFAPPWGPYTFHRVKDPKAWRGHYIVMGSAADYLAQSIGDGAFLAPSKAELVAERCKGCGRVELAFTKYPVGGNKLQQLATVDLSGKSDHQVVVDLKLPRRRLEADGSGYIVLLRLSGSPRLSGVGFDNS